MTRASGRDALVVVVWDEFRFSLVLQQAPLWLSSFHDLLAWHHPRCLFRAKKGMAERAALMLFSNYMTCIHQTFHSQQELL